MSTFSEQTKRPIRSFSSVDPAPTPQPQPADMPQPIAGGVLDPNPASTSGPVVVAAPVVEPAGGSANTRIRLENTSNPCFTQIDMNEEIIAPFVREYTPHLALTECVAEVPMLLSYMVKEERAFGVTLPFRACGVDTIVFDSSSIKQQGGPDTVEVPVGNQEDGDHTAFYEKITVDGIVFLSCISESLDPDYLHRIISEAADAVYIHGQYVYTMVGPRPLKGRMVEVSPATTETDAAAGKQQEFIETLKLNSFELSVFIRYMRAIEGINITYGTYNGRQAILFQR